MDQTKQSITDHLKTLGYNNTQVSVRRDHAGAYTITIRNASVLYAHIQEVEKAHEHVHRDERSGEVLMGANTYVDIEIADNVVKIWEESYLPLVIAAFDKLNAVHDASTGFQIDERFTIHWEVNRRYIKVYDKENSWLQHDYDPRNLAGIALDLFLLTQKPGIPENAPTEPIANAKITYNHAKNGIELRFDPEASPEIVRKLTADGFRWSGYQKMYYIPDSSFNRFKAQKYGKLPEEEKVN